MFVLDSYAWAVVFCVVTMLCWGSWANTQKLAGRAWRFELFYWDYALGVLLLSVIMAFTLGSLGEAGRNILLVAAIAIAGMSVAFPVGIGLALVIGVVVNYIATPVGNPVILFLGVGLVTAAIILDAAAYRRLPNQGQGVTTKGLVLSIICGILMGFFYRFVADSMSTDFINLEDGKLGPYSAVFFFSLGLLVSNFIINPIIMKKPFVGEPVAMAEYFKGGLTLHAIGILGGVIWAIGMTFSIIASGQAGFAISYGLGQGATMVAALWGVFIWKEFEAAPKSTGRLLTLMFLGYLAGLALIIAARFQ